MRALAPAATLLIGLLASAAAFGQAPPPPAPAPAPPTPAPAPAPAAAPTPPPPTYPAAQGGTAPAPEGPPGYYVEQGQAPPAPPPNAQPYGARPYGPPPYGAPPAYEPPPPGLPMVVYEPPPPPEPRHLAPRNSLWLGARVGWFVPFGSAYAVGVADPYGNVFLTSVPWSDYVRSGPSFEFDAGMRLGRHYNLFGLWQRTQFRSGNAERSLHGGQNGGDSDFFAAGLRASSDADGFGLATEIAIGYRQARAKWADGTELLMTGGAFESRIGIGADLRLSPLFSVSPMLELGIGSFDDVRRVVPGGGSYNVLGPYDASGSHGWWMFSIGGWVDLFGGG